IVPTLCDPSQEHRVHIKIMPDLLRTELPAFVAEYGSAGHHPEFRHSGKAADDSVCNSVGEILDVGVSTHVYERQYSYGVNPPGPESAQEPLAPVARGERKQQKKQDASNRGCNKCSGAPGASKLARNN